MATRPVEELWNLIRSQRWQPRARCSQADRALPGHESWLVRRPPVPDHGGGSWCSAGMVPPRWQASWSRSPADSRSHEAPSATPGRWLISTWPHRIDLGLSTATGFRLGRSMRTWWPCAWSSRKASEPLASAGPRPVEIELCKSDHLHTRRSQRGSLMWPSDIQGACSSTMRRVA
jgi:hypothetical protein